MSIDAPPQPRLRVRTVKVELLRAGPAHNQLLSPLTPYLGICNGAEAGVVTVPFEHHAFMRSLSRLRNEGEETRERLPALRDMGMSIAGVLGAIPHLPGSLDGDWAGRTTSCTCGWCCRRPSWRCFRSSSPRSPMAAARCPRTGWHCRRACLW